MARVKAAPMPRYVLHPLRPAWGTGLVLDDQEGRVRVQFADGIVRSFRGDVLTPTAAPALAAAAK